MVGTTPWLTCVRTSPVTYELDLPAASNIHPIMHVSLLKPWTGVDMRAPPLPKAAAQDEYEIESILAHRNTKGGAKKYLVKWKGYTFEECTWEPEKNFKSHTLRDYHAKRKADKDEESASDDESVMVMISGDKHAEAFPRACRAGLGGVSSAEPPPEVEQTSISPATGANAIPLSVSKDA